MRGTRKKLDSGKPSKTAQFMALFRALEYTYPRERRLFEDPLAMRFLSPALKAAVRASRLAWVRKGVVRLLDGVWTGARASGVARTRLIDDFLRRGIGEGCAQVVILGAGYDSRAYRLPELRGLRVFEADHPSTLRLKKEKLRGAPFDRGHVAYAEIDFLRQSLAGALEGAGFDRARPAFFIWEGVTNYLDEAAVRQTLAYIGSLAPGTRLAFTYVHRGAVDAPEAHVKAGVSRLLKKQGEPWTYGILPEELPALLRECGLRLLEDTGSVDYRKRYMYARGAHLDGYEFYRAALAAKPIANTEDE
ncbi:MAG: class I SAM-dependent methyltransferase [Oscillospiraceae bacterium]|jgi:methyltransferase (TIGR00027 family)|nr:class I SAM-dependent methyltransferase [Oscillospiraceae bacterium]